MNQRGQGFSVFKLLIAAIVAVFILTILLQILSGITPPTQGDPNQEAASKIKTLVNLHGTPQKTGKVIFKKDAPILSARTIADQTGAVTGGQICLDVSQDIERDLYNPTLFERDSERLVRYIGNQDMEAKLSIICDAENQMYTSLEDARLTNTYDNYDFDNCITDRGLDSSSRSQTICLVSIVPTT